MLRYVHHAPKGASGRSYLPGKNMESGPALVNNGAAGEVRLGSQAPLRLSADHFCLSPTPDILSAGAHISKVPRLEIPRNTFDRAESKGDGSDAFQEFAERS